VCVCLQQSCCLCVFSGSMRCRGMKSALKLAPSILKSCWLLLRHCSRLRKSSTSNSFWPQDLIISCSLSLFWWPSQPYRRCNGAAPAPLQPTIVTVDGVTLPFKSSSPPELAVSYSQAAVELFSKFYCFFCAPYKEKFFSVAPSVFCVWLFSALELTKLRRYPIFLSLCSSKLKPSCAARRS
jgi:hypothetical protein